jgi:hypothetical protein
VQVFEIEREEYKYIWHFSTMYVYRKSCIQNKCFNYKTKAKTLDSWLNFIPVVYWAVWLFSVYFNSLYTWCMLSVDFIRLESVNPNIHQFINVSLVIRNTQSLGPSISYDKGNINNTISNQVYYGRISGSCFTIATRHVTLVTNLVISHEWGKDRVFLMTRETLIIPLATRGTMEG